MFIIAKMILFFAVLNYLINGYLPTNFFTEFHNVIHNATIVISTLKGWFAYVFWFVPFDYIRPILVATLGFWILRIIMAIVNFVKGLF